MLLSKKPIEEGTLGLRVTVCPHEGDKYNCKIQSIDMHRKVLEIGLPAHVEGRWVEGIAYVIRTLWSSSLHCVIAIDYDQWCAHLDPLDLQTLEKCLPEEFFYLRVYSVPEKCPLRYNGGEMSKLVKKAYLKKRAYRKRQDPNLI